MKLNFLTAWVCLLILSACQIDPGNINSNQSRSIDFLTPNQSYFLINSVNPDYSASAISLVAAENPRLQRNDILAEGSDFFAQCRGEHIYHIGRFQRDRITKYHIESGMQWQIKTLDQQDSGTRESLKTANPQRLIFDNNNQALLTRFDSQWSWLLDLSDGTKKNEISFASYADLDGLPEMTNGIFDAGYIYLIHNRIARLGQSWQFKDKAYLSKISLASLSEVDFALDQSVAGIPLKLKNFQAPPVLFDQLLFLAATGNLIASTYGAGLEVVDPTTGSTNVHLPGVRVQKVVANAGELFVVVYKDWNNFELHRLSLDNITKTYKISATPLIANVQDVISANGSLWVLKNNHVYQYALAHQNNLVKSNEFKLNTKMQAQSIQHCQY